MSESRGCPSFKASKGDAVIFYREPLATQKMGRHRLSQADIALKLADYHLQPFGIVHGGVVATVIDTATFWSAFLRLSENDGLVNIDLKLNYLQPLLDGRLIARGTCIWPGNTISYSEAKVFDDNERLIAHGTSTLMVLKGKGLIMTQRTQLGKGARLDNPFD